MQVSGGTTNPSAFNTTNAVVFRTMQDFGKTVIDYTLTDQIRVTLYHNGAITITNEGGTITADTNDYNKMFPNARRDNDDLIITRLYTGPTRYLHSFFLQLRLIYCIMYIDTTIQNLLMVKAVLLKQLLLIHQEFYLKKLKSLLHIE